MGSENLGAAMASGRTHVVTRHHLGPVARRIAAAANREPEAEPTPAAPVQPPDRRSARRGQRWLVVLALLATALSASVGLLERTANAASSYLLMPRSELLALPTSGAAWTGLKAVADQALSTPDLCNQDAQHHLRTFASALVYARTGVDSYGTKARAGVLAAIRTQRDGCGNAVLAMGRQLTAYVLAANLAGLSGTDDATFRTWLSTIRAKVIGGHPTWKSLVVTHGNSANNWGAYAGASRIAADLYLGDTIDLAVASRITRGFLGDRTAYAGFTDNLSSAAISWSCSGSSTTYTPENPGCTKSGINLDGGVAADISRGGSLRWPPSDPGIPYQLESIQGVGLQVELLYRNGYPAAWGWGSDGLKRAAALVTRSAAAGGAGWNATTTSRQMPWLLNRRYGTSIPTRTSGMGRAIGFTDWLYGSGAASQQQPPPTTRPTATPAPTPRPTATPAPGATATPKPTATPTPSPTTRPTSGSAPLVKTPAVALGATTVPTTGVAVLVRWAPAITAAGLRRYDLQVRIDDAAWSGLTLTTATSTARWVVLRTGHQYSFRVRAVDGAGRVGAWAATGWNRVGVTSDASTSVTYRGTWATASYATYLGTRAHWTRSSGATVTYRFSGTSVSVIGPRGPGRGRSAVYVDGTYRGTIDQLASSFVPRRVLFAVNLAEGTHTIVVKALGTAGRPMVAIDAFETRNPD